MKGSLLHWNVRKPKDRDPVDYQSLQDTGSDRIPAVYSKDLPCSTEYSREVCPTLPATITMSEFPEGVSSRADTALEWSKPPTLRNTASKRWTSQTIGSRAHASFSVPRKTDIVMNVEEARRKTESNPTYWTLGSLGGAHRSDPAWQEKYNKLQRQRTFGRAVSNFNKRRLTAAKHASVLTPLYDKGAEHRNVASNSTGISQRENAAVGVEEVQEYQQREEAAWLQHQVEDEIKAAIRLDFKTPRPPGW